MGARYAGATMNAHREFRIRALKPTFALLALMVIAACMQGVDSHVTPVSAYSQDGLRTEAIGVFTLLEAAEARGANVTAAAFSLNQAMVLIASGGQSELGQAASIIQQVNSSIPSLVAEGESARYWGTAGLAATLTVLGIAGVLVFLFMPRLVWRLWARSKKGWKVSAQ